MTFMGLLGRKTSTQRSLGHLSRSVAGIIGCKNSQPELKMSHDKTNKIACVPSEDSDQPGHLPSQIRVFAMCSIGN